MSFIDYNFLPILFFLAWNILTTKQLKPNNIDNTLNRQTSTLSVFSLTSLRSNTCEQDLKTFSDQNGVSNIQNTEDNNDDNLMNQKILEDSKGEKKNDALQFVPSFQFLSEHQKFFRNTGLKKVDKGLNHRLLVSPFGGLFNLYSTNQNLINNHWKKNCKSNFFNFTYRSKRKFIVSSFFPYSYKKIKLLCIGLQSPLNLSISKADDTKKTNCLFDMARDHRKKTSHPLVNTDFKPVQNKHSHFIYTKWKRGRVFEYPKHGGFFKDPVNNLFFGKLCFTKTDPIWKRIVGSYFPKMRFNSDQKKKAGGPVLNVQNRGVEREVPKKLNHRFAENFLNKIVYLQTKKKKRPIKHSTFQRNVFFKIMNTKKTFRLNFIQKRRSKIRFYLRIPTQKIYSLNTFPIASEFSKILQSPKIPTVKKSITNVKNTSKAPNKVQVSDNTVVKLSFFEQIRNIKYKNRKNVSLFFDYINWNMKDKISNRKTGLFNTTRLPLNNVSDFTLDKNKNKVDSDTERKIPETRVSPQNQHFSRNSKSSIYSDPSFCPKNISYGGSWYYEKAFYDNPFSTLSSPDGDLLNHVCVFEGKHGSTLPLTYESRLQDSLTRFFNRIFLKQKNVIANTKLLHSKQFALTWFYARQHNLLQKFRYWPYNHELEYEILLFKFVMSPPFKRLNNLLKIPIDGPINMKNYFPITLKANDYKAKSLQTSLEYDIGVYSLAHRLSSIGLGLPNSNNSMNISPFKYNDSYRYHFEDINVSNSRSLRKKTFPCKVKFLDFQNPNFLKTSAPIFQPQGLNLLSFLDNCFFQTKPKLIKRTNSNPFFHRRLKTNLNFASLSQVKPTIYYRSLPLIFKKNSKPNTVISEKRLKNFKTLQTKPFENVKNVHFPQKSVIEKSSIFFSSFRQLPYFFMFETLSTKNQVLPQTNLSLFSLPKNFQNGSKQHHRFAKNNYNKHRFFISKGLNGNQNAKSPLLNLQKQGFETRNTLLNNNVSKQNKVIKPYTGFLQPKAFGLKSLSTFVKKEIGYETSPSLFSKKTIAQLNEKKNFQSPVKKIFNKMKSVYFFNRNKTKENTAFLPGYKTEQSIQKNTWKIFPPLFQPLTFRFRDLNLPNRWSTTQQLGFKPLRQTIRNNKSPKKFFHFPIPFYFSDFFRSSTVVIKNVKNTPTYENFNESFPLSNFFENSSVKESLKVLYISKKKKAKAQLFNNNLKLKKKIEKKIQKKQRKKQRKKKYRKLLLNKIIFKNSKILVYGHTPVLKNKTLHGPPLKNQKQLISIPNYLKNITNQNYQNLSPNNLNEFFFVVWILLNKGAFIYLFLYYLRQFILFLGSDYIRNLLQILITLQFMEGNVLNVIKTFQDFNFYLKEQNAVDVTVNQELKNIKRND